MSISHCTMTYLQNLLFLLQHLSHLTPPPCSGSNTEEGMERLRVRRWGYCCETVFWTYEAIALVSTRQLWLHKTKMLNFTAETEEGHTRLHPQLRSAWQLVATGRGRLISVWVCAPGKLSVPWGMASHPFIPRRHYLD